MTSSTSSPDDVEGLLRELAPQVLGALVRRHSEFGDAFVDAEDAVQEALLAAAQRWPVDGVPAYPRGWLTTVASRRLAEMWRADAARRRRETLAAAQEPASPPTVSDMDDSLALLFLCCHPVLPASAAIPLTLRAVGGLTTAEIARAFLLPRAGHGQADQQRQAAHQRLRDRAANADTGRVAAAAACRTACGLFDFQ